MLGLDYGSVRIGVALSDPLKIIAQGYTTIDNTSRFFEQLVKIIAEKNVTLIVVGLPLTLKGERGIKSDEVDDFIVKLKMNTPLDVVQWDERFTSKSAQQSIIAMGTKKMKRRDKGKIDEVAAAIMLQGFLDQTKRSLCC